MENREFYISRDEVKLHAKLDFPANAEKCPLVIVVHGLTGHMEEPHIRAIAKALTENGYAALRVELYGHGKSGGTFFNHTVPEWEQDLLTVIDYAKNLDFVTDLYLTGHSQGGLTVILTAAMKVDCLKAIMPLAPAVSIRDFCLGGKFLGLEFDPDHVPEEGMLFDEHRLSGNYVRMGQFLPIEAAIRRWKKPVLIVHSDTDELIPISYAEWTADLYENAELKVIHGDNHVFEQHIDEVTDAMLAFLKRVSADGAEN